VSRCPRQHRFDNLAFDLTAHTHFRTPVGLGPAEAEDASQTLNVVGNRTANPTIWGHKVKRASTGPDVGPQVFLVNGTLKIGGEARRFKVLPSAGVNLITRL